MTREYPTVPQIVPALAEQRHGRRVRREMVIRLRHPDGTTEDLGPFPAPIRGSVAVTSTSPGIAAVVLYRTVTEVYSPWVVR